MATEAGATVGLYLVNAIAGHEGTPGAPLLHLSLMVNAVTGAVTGQVVQTQAVAAPNDKIVIRVTGRVRKTGLGQYTQIVALQGEAVISFPPPAIGSYMVPFDAHFATTDQWKGVGGWTLGHTNVENVQIHSVGKASAVSASE